MLAIKPVNDQLIDVFTGTGWTNWSRFYVSYDKGRVFLKLVKGNPMDKQDFKQLYEQVNS